MTKIKAGEIQLLVPTPESPDQCTPFGELQALMEEIRTAFACLLKKAGWATYGVPEERKIRAFLANLPEPGVDGMRACIRENLGPAQKAGMDFYNICATPDVTVRDLHILTTDIQTAIRMFCLNEQLIQNNCIEVTEEIKNIQNVLNH